MPQLEDDASAIDLRKDMEEEENNISEYANNHSSMEEEAG